MQAIMTMNNTSSNGWECWVIIKGLGFES